MMEAHSSDDICFAPGCSAISGGEGHHEKIDTCEAVDRHNHGPVRLHKGLPTDAMRIVGGRLCRSPLLSAVGRGTHLDQVAQRIVVEFGITVAEERAAGCSIADSPVFVVKMPIGIHWN